LGLKLGAAGIAKFVPLFGIFLATRNEMRWKEPIDVQESRAEVGEVLPEESRCLEAEVPRIQDEIEVLGQSSPCGHA
jgi:hypothetical protein